MITSRHLLYLCHTAKARHNRIDLRLVYALPCGERREGRVRYDCNLLLEDVQDTLHLVQDLLEPQLIH